MTNELNTDLTDLSDVTDEAIDAAMKAARVTWFEAPFVRRCAESSSWAQSVILLARCIQAHYPEMIVDPVTAKAGEIARQVMADMGLQRDQGKAYAAAIEAAKAAILAGMAMERDS